MSQTKLHKLTVKQRENSEGPSTGANTEVFLDGKLLNGITFLKLEFKAKKMTKITLEMYTEIDKIEGNYELGKYSKNILNKT